MFMTIVMTRLYISTEVTCVMIVLLHFLQTIQLVVTWNTLFISCRMRITKVRPHCLQCFDSVGWETGRASGL